MAENNIVKKDNTQISKKQSAYDYIMEQQELFKSMKLSPTMIDRYEIIVSNGTKVLRPREKEISFTLDMGNHSASITQVSKTLFEQKKWAYPDKKRTESEERVLLEEELGCSVDLKETQP